MNRIAQIVCLAALLPTWTQAATIGFTLNGNTERSAGSELQVKVMDELTGAVIPSAAVTVETRTVADTSWKVVTVEASGYATQRIYGVRGGKLTFFMKKSTDPAQVVISGSMKSWPKRSSMSNVQGGMTLQMIGAGDLLDLDSRKVISPLRDTIQVFGARKIPSNVMLPDQDVFLPIGGVSLNKPDYRMPVRADQPVSLSSVQMEIRVSDILPSFQPGGKISIDLLNKIKILKVGMSTPFTPDRDQKLTLDADLSLEARHEVTVRRPSYAADVFVASVVDLHGDRSSVLPTDFKVAINGEKPGAPIRPVTLLSTVQEVGRERLQLGIAMADRGNRLSGVLSAGNGKVVQMDEFLTPPALPGFSRVPERIRLAATPSGITSLVLSAKDSVTGARVPQAILHVLPLAGEVLVDDPQSLAGVTVDQYSISQFEFAAGFDESEMDGSRIFRGLTRFTRAAAKQAP